MTRRGKAVTRAIAEHYWQQIQILDAFWQGTFTAFVKPLEDIYCDPVSAGAAILSRYLENSASILKEVELAPESFGELRNQMGSARMDTALLTTPAPGCISLEDCARAFKKARQASLALDQIRSANASAFEELQKERLKRKTARLVEPRPNQKPTALRALVRRKI
ncbi:MAG: hypothetical protein JSR78_05140 [Proteobacteria bacterium]|nr:hypothetical protein [Pseudomonadota bacterium]